VVSGLPAFAALAVLVVLTAVSLRFYLPLAGRVLVRGEGRVGDAWVGTIDGLVAIVLVAWFAMMGRNALSGEGNRAVEFGHILSGAVIYASLVIFLAGLLVYRDRRPVDVFGLGALGFTRALWRSLLMLAAAYPLLMLVQAMVYGAAGAEMSPQDVVQFLQNAETPRDRLAVLAMAVVVAPVAEEMIFRGYLYPVGKKYAGAFASMVVTSLLFAVLHGHAGSIPALFTLAMCLGLAYEKSGTLIVPMIMHAVFNAVSVTAILFFL
jgi:membrane protease YdiL (CAAX protease family)